jgi:hypothetical protein
MFQHLCLEQVPRLDGVRAYYEPWHEQLARLTPRPLERRAPDNSGLRHPGGASPIWANSNRSCDPAGGVLGFRTVSPWTAISCRARPGRPGQQAYVEA